MANMVQITEPPIVRGDDVEVHGTVDGNAVTVHVWLSHLMTLATWPLRKTYCRKQLKDSYLAAVAAQGTEQTDLVDVAPVST